mmetsp:Transcript_20277/g.51332  ORF Transcript_20277/g.51332 Transcript_20277/m.51332 type:complete len:201 (-) Transcript_20277:376-978(-)
MASSTTECHASTSVVYSTAKRLAALYLTYTDSAPATRMTRPAPTCRMLACSSPARGAVTRVITAHATAMLNAVVMSAPTMGVPPKCGPSGLAFMRRDWYLYTEYANAPARGKDWSEENSAHSPSAAYTAPSLMSVVGVTMGSMRSKIFFVQLGLGPSPITSVRRPVRGGRKPCFWRSEYLSFRILSNASSIDSRLGSCHR